MSGHPAQRGASRAAGDAGFTLLEMLVAVMIMSILVALVPRTLVSARAIVGRSDAWLQARLVAEDVLNEQLAGADLKPGVQRGVRDGFRWSAVVEPNRALVVSAPESGRILLNVKVSVAVTDAQNLDVETLRIGQGG